MKTLTLDNWLELDEAIAITEKVTTNGRIERATASDWLPLILEPQLISSAPQEVYDLFAVARAAMAYGLLFSPLQALSIEQLFRVVEAAVFHRTKIAGAIPPHQGYLRNINWLISNNIISDTDRERWSSLKDARDFASHPREQQTVNPATAIHILRSVVESINSLFGGA